MLLFEKKVDFYSVKNCVSPIWYIEVLIPNVTDFRGKAFKEIIRLNEAIRIGT